MNSQNRNSTSMNSTSQNLQSSSNEAKLRQKLKESQAIMQSQSMKIAECEQEITQQTLQIQSLQSAKQTMQSKIQKLGSELQTSESNNEKLQQQNNAQKSKLTELAETIKNMTARAELYDEADNIKAEAAKLRNEAKEKLEAARLEYEAAAKDRQDARTARRNEQKAQEEKKFAETAAENEKYKAAGVKDRWRIFGICVAVFAAALAIFNAADHLFIFPEMWAWVEWWGRLIGNFFSTTWGWQISGAVGFNAWLSGLWAAAPAAIGYVLLFLLYIALNIALVVVIIYGFMKLLDLCRHIAFHHGYDNELKGCIIALAAVILLFACMFFYDEIKTLIDINITTTWILSTLIFSLLLAAPAIYRKIRRKIKGYGY